MTASMLMPLGITGVMLPELDLDEQLAVGGLRRVKGDYDELGFIRTDGKMCSLSESDPHIPARLGAIAELKKEVPLIIEGYWAGMTGAAKAERAGYETNVILRPRDRA